MDAPSEGDNNDRLDRTEEAGTNKRQLCYEVTKAAYDFTLVDMDGLDAKASNFITFIGVITGIYSGFSINSLNSIDKTKILIDGISYYILALGVLIAGLILLLSSILCALIAYRLYNITIVPNPPYFYEHYVINNARTKDDILDSLIVAFVSAFNSNNDARGNKSFYISASFILLLIGSAFGVIFMGIAFIAPKTIATG